MSAIDLIHLCTNKHLTLGSCESLTAGLFTSTLASVPGASKVLKGGIVTYWTEVKESVVGVDRSIVEKYGVVSEACAKEMAMKSRRLLDVDYAVSFTGNAGPDVMEGKPAGMVCCAISSQDDTTCYTFRYNNLKRNEVRQKVVDDMIELLIQKLR